MLNRLLAPLSIPYEVYAPIMIILLSLMVIASIILVVVVLLQDSNSSGAGAITGQSETFANKNGGNNKEKKLRLYTVIAVASLSVLSIIFFIINLIA